MCSGFEAGSYARLIDSCVSLNSRLESNNEEEEDTDAASPANFSLCMARMRASAVASASSPFRRSAVTA